MVSSQDQWLPGASGSGAGGGARGAAPSSEERDATVVSLAIKARRVRTYQPLISLPLYCMSPFHHRAAPHTQRCGPR